MNSPLSIIAEIGVNHNGDLHVAKELLLAASEAGATHVKIQMFDPKLLVSGDAPLADYQVENGIVARSQMEMLESLTLNREAVFEIDRMSQKLGIPLIATPFDLQSLSFITSELQHQTVKIGSGDLTFHQLIFETTKSGAGVIISTGMSYLDEVMRAVHIARAGREIHLGNLPADFAPTLANLKNLAPDSSGDTSDWLTLLHCTSTYPAPIDQLNISAIQELRPFGARLGYSDHSQSSYGAIMAVAAGATVFEKHLTLSRTGVGPDHSASLEPNEFKSYVSDIHSARMALGDGVKRPQLSEQNVRSVARRSIFVAQDIEVGDVYSDSNLVALRPGDGISTENYYELLGTAATKRSSVGNPVAG